MTDRPNSPIRIPIRFVDGENESREPDFAEDDVIEIDGDDLDAELNADAEPQAVPEPPQAQQTAIEEVRPAPVVVEVNATPEAPDAAASRGPEPSAPGAELSVEAFAEMSRELRQKTEAAERLLVEKNDLYDRLLRKQAEFENFRKRSERDMQDTYRRARADILLDILPALDNFQLAMEHADTADATVLREGFSLIYKQLTDVLGRHGLEAVDAEGRPFDPELHEAVATEVHDELDENTVVQEFQRGYKIGDKLLRPARVKVSTQG